MNRLLFIFLLMLLVANAAAQRETEVIETPQQVENNGLTLKRKVAIGRFSNETQYAKGIFYDKENDPMGKQALDILSVKLAATGKFILLERNDLASLLDECQKGNGTAQTIGADYMIIGSVTEYGRKETGKNRVFSAQKTQTVDAAVAVRLVDVSTGLIIYADEAKGSAEVTTKTTLGVGGQAGYDATLSDKAISEAIGQEHCEQVCRQPMEDLLHILRHRRSAHSRRQESGHNGGHDVCHKDQGEEGEEPADRHHDTPAWQEGGAGYGDSHGRQHARDGVFGGDGGHVRKD